MAGEEERANKEEKREENKGREEREELRSMRPHFRERKTKYKRLKHVEKDEQKSSDNDVQNSKEMYQEALVLEPGQGIWLSWLCRIRKGGLGRNEERKKA